MMTSSEKRRIVCLIFILGITIIPTLIVLYYTPTRSNFEVLTEDNAKFEISSNENFLIFWAVLFFSCIVGIIELLQLLTNEDGIVTKALYLAVFWILILGVVTSVSRAWCIMRENFFIMNGGLLGPDYQEYTQSNLSLFDSEIVRSIWFEAGLILFMVLIFDLLFSIKIGLWSEKRKVSVSGRISGLIDNLTQISIRDTIFLCIFFILFLFVIVDIATPFFRSFFVPVPLLDGLSAYGFISLLAIFSYGTFWGFSKILYKFKNEKNIKEKLLIFISKVFSFIGVSKPNLKCILCYTLIGFSVNFLLLLAFAILKNAELSLTIPTNAIFIFEKLVYSPIIEEIVFRGIYLAVFLKILGRNKLVGFSSLIMSSFTFGWFHSGLFCSLILKTIGGFVLGVIYLANWKKKFVPAVFTHAGLNLTGIFLAVD